jgi:hypothetical protein
MRHARDQADHAQLACATVAPSRNGTGSVTVLPNIFLQTGALDFGTRQVSYRGTSGLGIIQESRH